MSVSYEKDWSIFLLFVGIVTGRDQKLNIPVVTITVKHKSSCNVAAQTCEGG